MNDNSHGHHSRRGNSRQSRMGFSLKPGAGAVTGRYRNSTVTRSSNRRMDSSGAGGHHQLRQKTSKAAAYRRYRVGENVLVFCNAQQWSTLVNQHGFPPGEGSTPEEQSGPYLYVFATVQQVHFDEFAEYYTVLRADTGEEERGDTGN